MTKLKDEFAAFKDLKGNPHDEEDDGVDFDPDEEEQPDKTAEPEVQGDEPDYEDMIDGPLPGRGLGRRTKILGQATLSMGSSVGTASAVATWAGRQK